MSQEPNQNPLPGQARQYDPRQAGKPATPAHEHNHSHDHSHEHGHAHPHDHEHHHHGHGHAPQSSYDPAKNPLAGRRLILCQNHPPANCVHCDRALPPISRERLLMIDAQGEAGVIPGPVQLCQGCDAVYVHEVHYGAIAREFGFDPYTLIGFIDLNLLPEDQRDQPIGEDPDAEIPLLEFTAVQLLQQARFD